MEEIQLELINLAIVVITALISWGTKELVAFLKKKGIVAQLENNKELVKIVVGAVEQTYKHFDGNQKLNMAKLELVKLMNEKKIKISEKEIDLLIEAMVKEMKESAKQELKK